MKPSEDTLFCGLERICRRASARRARLSALVGAGAAVALMAQLVAPAPVGAQVPAPGSVDTTFGDDGIVTTAVSPFRDAAAAVVVQPDGKLVVAGMAETSGPGEQLDSDFALVRYNADGSVDTTFGVGGTATTDFFGAVDDVRAMVRQPDGKLVVAGEVRQPWDPTNPGTRADFGLARFNADGSVDTTFGVGGRATVDFGFWDRPSALARQSDGKLVVAGHSGAGGIGVARFNTNGTLDSTFGTGGRVATEAGGFDQARAVAVQPDGKLVVAGTVWPSGALYRAIGLARFNADGTFDPTFGTGGVVATYYAWGTADALALLIRPDGTLLVGGHAVFPSRPYPYSSGVLLRYLPNGWLDWTFGYFGWVFSAGRTGTNELVEQPDGRIVASGGPREKESRRAHGLERYHSNGALDTSFGNGGLVTAEGSSAAALVRQADGKLVTAGHVLVDTPEDIYMDFALRRFNP